MIHARKKAYLVFDIGGTNSRVAISFDGKTLADFAQVETPQKFEDAEMIYHDLVEKVAKGIHIEHAAVALTGVFDHIHGVPFWSPHAKAWKGKPVKKMFDRVTGVNTLIENDTTLAALGEAREGAGKGKKIVVYFTVSTGIGGARIVDGKIDEKRFGFEVGHQIIDITNNESLEEAASASHLNAKHGTFLWTRNDENAHVWKEAEKRLAIGLYNSILHWSPDVIVLGGPLLMKNYIQIDALRIHLQALMDVFPKVPELRTALLEGKQGLIGALEYIKLHK
jgi:predicted NBD/HSP70 family sugar kinase